MEQKRSVGCVQDSENTQSKCKAPAMVPRCGREDEKKKSKKKRMVDESSPLKK
ncbi:hypothetical protein BofuT4_uP143610.1 [Botrytis cinerea T4]|uniref:Uncharacterized protein n=1 Tax=Botryotinia fuckeliana (strain T4) TaxID=999810 RepID=G2YY55_BOTF4|nr:hypothetical protein BofuT4_uP143610.1 [Botrytis cinerea T4]